MIRLATVIDTFEADFLAHYRQRLQPEHRRALAAMKRCRTSASPTMQIQRSECDPHQRVPHSCGHRHCPHCQHHESQQWLERQRRKRISAEYFLLTFTLPAEFRPLAFAHQRLVYDLLIGCAWETVRTFSQNDQALQGIPGAIAVLHTNTRRLDYHPHVHLIMPAGAVNLERKQWRTRRRGKTKAGYLFNHKALAKVFRAKILAGLEAADLTLPRRYPQAWVVDCKSVGNGEPALIYLGRYLYRGVIQERDLLACGDGQVRFRYRDAKTGRTAIRTVSGAEFLWLMLQHVLPKGFRRARNFGFLHPNCKRLIALLQVVLKCAPEPMTASVRARAPIVCTCCGAVMVIVKTGIRAGSPATPPLPIAVPIGALTLSTNSPRADQWRSVPVSRGTGSPEIGCRAPSRAAIAPRLPHWPADNRRLVDCPPGNTACRGHFRKAISYEARAHSTIGLVQQTVQIVARFAITI